MLNPWLGMALVTITLAGLVALLRVIQQRFSPHPELIRKALHMVMGLVTLGFPWLFENSWPVWLLAGASMVGLLAVKFNKGLKKQLGDVVYGIKRESLGELYFPLAVAIIFQLADGDPVRYCIPILILTLADAFAALVGTRYGQLHYSTAEGMKSVEGSITFFTIAFLSVHIPLLLFTEVSRLDSLLIASIMGLLVMMFEAIAWRGLDNLFIPLGSYALLDAYLDMDTSALVLRLVIILLLAALMLSERRRTTLNHSAALGVVLVGYVCWALGGWQWLVPPLILLLSYSYLARRARQLQQGSHSIHAVVSVSAAALLWLFLGKTLQQGQLLFPFTIAFAAQLAIIGIARLRYRSPDMAALTVLTWSVVQGWFLLFIPYLLINGFAVQSWIDSGIGLLAVMAAALLFTWLQPGLEDCPTDTPRWWRQGLIGGGVSLFGLLPLAMA